MDHHKCLKTNNQVTLAADKAAILIYEFQLQKKFTGEKTL